jgi:hypothetical protein
MPARIAWASGAASGHQRLKKVLRKNPSFEVQASAFCNTSTRMLAFIRGGRKFSVMGIYHENMF